VINYRSNRKNVENGLNKAEDRALTAVGMFVQGESQLRTPVQTGNLRDSNGYKVNGMQVIVGNGVEYSLFVHEGTSRQRPQKFLEDAVMSNTSKIKALIERYLKL
jgi:HK97 gp10 family phage protein